jgi:hypothetical protein
MSACTERSRAGSSRCSLTRQGAITASTMAWVPTSARYRQRAWGNELALAPLAMRPKKAALAGVSAMSSKVLSMAISRSPQR